jgi:formamidopyrimidine-DNA glycosylase
VKKSTNIYNKYKGTFLSVFSKGKKIFIKILLDNGREIYLASFLGMEGHWLYKKAKYSTITMHLGILKKIGNKLLDISNKNIYYDDSCKFGFLKILGTEEEFNDEYNVMGPDYLSGDITYEIFKTKIQSTRIVNKYITSFLLEQKWFSGIGNYLKSEILWLACISPHRLIGTLLDEEIELLYKSIMEIIIESYNKGGLTISTYKGPNGELGLYEPLAYKRKIDNNGDIIIAEKIGDDRNTYWCPTRQK